MSCASIASAMGISRRAVEKHYARARARVTTSLKAYRDV
jgi:DNA-directed RNA polymerase specialized sigma24 family protein